MRKYNSGEQTITIPLAEFQSLTLADRVLNKLLYAGRVSGDAVAEAQLVITKEDDESN